MILLMHLKIRYFLNNQIKTLLLKILVNKHIMSKLKDEESKRNLNKKNTYMKNG